MQQNPAMPGFFGHFEDEHIHRNSLSYNSAMTDRQGSALFVADT
jgi:hypothetical protein